MYDLTKSKIPWLARQDILYSHKKKLYEKFSQKVKTLLYKYQCNNGKTEINFRKIFHNMRENSLCRLKRLVMILITILSRELT